MGQAGSELTDVKRVTRNRILIWIIFLGLANFAVYTFFYWYLEGDARNGSIRFVRSDDGVVGEAEYFLRGHFIRLRDGMASAPVSRAVWIYSFIHSISIWPTVGAVLVSMLILARPHIIATIKSDSVVTGRGFVNVFMAVVILTALVSTIIFVINLVQALSAAAAGRDYGW